MTEIKKGGQRSGAGRKPVQDKKVPVTVYLNKSLVESLGRGRLVELMLSNLGEIPASEKPPVAQKSLEKEKQANGTKIQNKLAELLKTNKPERMKGESGVEYSFRLREWKEKMNQLPI